VHKKQGATLEKNHNQRCHKSNWWHHTKMTLRCNAFFEADTYTDDDFSYICPSNEAIDADKKLWHLSNKTLQQTIFSLQPNGAPTSPEDEERLLRNLRYHLQHEQPAKRKQAAPTTKTKKPK
jgi:hypothetical protein